ncbi:alpha-hydroxy-acid oxidizing protein, partial [Amphritea pacifica]|uniref:alpha-hydroxy-acid oxidizing protein n=1 Tax=Amphritea pacifica TaxID=2811233 RepID=UPI001966168F
MKTIINPFSPTDSNIIREFGIACARDYVSLAQRFIPADILAFISGGSGQDITLHNNETAFHRWAITPRVMPAPENATTARSITRRCSRSMR